MPVRVLAVSTMDFRTIPRMMGLVERVVTESWSAVSVENMEVFCIERIFALMIVASKIVIAERKGLQRTAKEKKKERVWKWRSRGVGFEWQFAEIFRFGFGRPELRLHCWYRAPWLLLPAKTRKLGLLLRRHRTFGRSLLQKDDWASCRVKSEGLRARSAWALDSVLWNLFSA